MNALVRRTSVCLALLAIAVAGFGRSDERRDSAIPSRDFAPDLNRTQTPAAVLRLDWAAQRALPDGEAGAFGIRSHRSVLTQNAVRTPPQEAKPPGPPPLPFAYVGKLAVGTERFAVLDHDNRVVVVRPGDAIGNTYRVQSIGEDRIVVLNLDVGIAQILAFSSGALHSVKPQAARAPSIDDVSLQISGPRQVALGEQFTLTLSLDSGMNPSLESGRVELRFDPKVLQLSGDTGPSSAGGSARVEIVGAYPGHPAPSTVQFRVVAPAPTATEIRVVPTSIANSEGRNVGINSPQAHRLNIVPATPHKGD